jgi:hypothetical protein
MARDADAVEAGRDASAVDGPADVPDGGQDSGASDGALDVSNMTDFITLMNGIWLVGWMGDLNHYSWVRIRSNPAGSGTGTADFLAGNDLAINSPYWQCSGQGQWMIPQKPDSILFTFPLTCSSLIEREYTFDPMQSPGTYPRGAILMATVTPLSDSAAVAGYKFPDTQCNADMTSCSDPL